MWEAEPPTCTIENENFGYFFFQSSFSFRHKNTTKWSLIQSKALTLCRFWIRSQERKQVPTARDYFPRLQRKSFRASTIVPSILLARMVQALAVSFVLIAAKYLIYLWASLLFILLYLMHFQAFFFFILQISSVNFPIIFQYIFHI